MTARRPLRDQLRLPLTTDIIGGAATFVRSGSNAYAVDALAAWPNAAGRVMALCGPAGCGKSHLASAWAERVGAIPLNGAEAALTDPLELEGRPVLLDIAQDADDETLFHLINLAQHDGGALLMVSRPSPRRWAVQVPDLRSRLDAVRVVAMEAPDDAVMSAILAARFAERSITPGDGVIDYLVLRIDRSAEAAAGIVARLDDEHRPITRALARQVLEASADLFSGTDEGLQP
ncbi:chromosomal replication initiator protein DnaA [Brevundimonas subvibrioides]|uniref:DnaA-related protein n=1 Tax=Brevundimonas subvibrioides (strain ATCC 15264 / DSM 4735 / LMG 14903 / NBRC 16000 / CB 81) TaxID=633149 RepID=D9QJG0_BRESC|nr:chromosomal replication initiator protein DnaA [Brevundimonas subvibrioides]ADL01521.1 DnaA-related protein [Brevundimonas subvibrioides ATCC 15264]